MLRAKVNGLSVAYERTGDGPALVLLHGFAVDSRMWRPQIESLSDKFTVIAWDAPGAGQSSDPPETFGIGEWADCLAGILRRGRDSTGTHRWSFLGRDPCPGVLSAPFRACAVACLGRYIRWLERFTPRTNR